MTRVLVATRSQGKRRELFPILAEGGFEGIDLESAGIPEADAESAIEAFETFEENALAKARYFFGMSGMPSFADDSGIEVDALGGRPGVRSKRYSGRSDLAGQALDDANNALLLAELAAFPPGTSREARYVCAAAYADGERELVVRGESPGRVLETPHGHGGFGYDPYFLSIELGRTFAEATLEEKAMVSHRGRAFRALVAALSARR